MRDAATLKKKMCSSKVSFWSKQAAEKVANKYGQRVYECPVCFCWHTTRLEDWREEFVTTDQLKAKIAEAETKLRQEQNIKLKERNLRIMELEKENKELRHELHLERIKKGRSE